MVIKFYNSLTKNIEEFPKKNSVSIYSCGPTVYDYAHIGNLRTFLFEDLLIRTLDILGYNIKHVRNITDIDDKTIRKSIEQNLSLKEFTNKYTEIFFNNLQQLNFNQNFTTYLKATDYIEEMIDLIEQLIIHKFAYVKDDGVYFNVKSFKKYGDFAGLDLEHIQHSISVDNEEFSKENYSDFVLWKKKKEEDGDNYWQSPWGEGRPGWHTECAAMVRNLFPDGLDIHTGGIDLLFPHHTNEKAHCECLSNKPMASFWIHATHLLVDHKKMSKSLGNFYTLKDLIDKGFSERTIRYYLLTGAHYQIPLNFTFDGLKSSESALKRINNFIEQLNITPREGESYYLKKKFLSHLCDNLNISGAMGEIFTLINNYYNGLEVDSKHVLKELVELNKVLGIFDFSEDKITDTNIENLFQQRLKAREEKNWSESDRLRHELLKYGIEVRDTKDGSSMHKIN